MSRTTHSSALRTLAGAGLLVAAALTAPTASHAQTSSEVALMNRLAPTVFIPSALAWRSAAAFPVPPDAANGEQALLARTSMVHGGDSEPIPADAAAASVSGGYALLGRSTAPEARRATSPNESR